MSISVKCARLLVAALMLAAGPTIAKDLKPWSGDRTPPLELKDLSGRVHRLADYRGKVVLINFWATWCPPCRTEMPDIQAAAQAHPDGLVVLAINNAEDAETVKRFAQQFNLTFPILLDSDGSVARKYGVQGLPTSFFIDRAGIVRAANMGAMSRAYIEAQIAALGAE